jgi:hypothetical protein
MAAGHTAGLNTCGNKHVMQQHTAVISGQQNPAMSHGMVLGGC